MLRFIAACVVAMTCANSASANTLDAVPSTAPASDVTLAPATAPSTAQAKFPTPSELIAKFKQIKAQQAALTKVAYIDLDAPISERSAGFSLFGGADRRTLHSVLQRLAEAREDKDVRAVLITIGADMQINMAQAQEIRDALTDLRRAGKRTFVYADAYDTDSYTLASGATDICMLAGGEIMIPGVGFETMFYKGVFDKVGVQADYVQIGEYKGAEEPYTRSSPSEELKGELTHLSEALLGQIVDGIALNRNMSGAAVRQFIDDSMMTGGVARDRGFVDHLVDSDGLRKLLKDELGNDIDLLKDYGEEEQPEIDFSNPLALFAAMAKKPVESDKPAIAVIYAEGVISDGSGEGGVFGESGVGSEAMRSSLRAAARDPHVKGIVIRIDSPGGSALASEVMWQAVRHAADDYHKPVIISIGSMAASGGYYLASAGDYLFADRCAIVGSIGVVGGKFVTKDLYEKLGLATQSFTQGRNADLFSSNTPWTDRQRRMVRNWMQETYDQFTQRVTTMRGEKIKDIDKVARGRVFLAEQAKELGMVDELGGLTAAVEYTAGRVELKNGDYEILSFPAPRTLSDYITGRSAADAATPIRSTLLSQSTSPLLEAFPSSARQLVSRQLQMIQLMNRRPFVLISPFIVQTH